MLKVRLQPPLELAYVLRSPDVYMVPRGEGQIVIGATVERAGFDRRVEPSVVERLHAKAAELWPPIASAPVVESWSGLRPGTQDGLPMIGSAGRPHCWVATGHFRNGILLAPATGLIVRQLLQGSRPEASLAAFVPGRASEQVTRFRALRYKQAVQKIPAGYSGFRRGVSGEKFFTRAFSPGKAPLR